VAARHALIIESQGERFRLYYDIEEPSVLHITRRHGTTPEEAVRTFFAGVTESWDESHLRRETHTDTHGPFWTRHAHDHSVIVISCFKRGDEPWID
jgi:hypothetical protein